MREGRRPLEQPKTRAYIYAFLDYMIATHGAIIFIIVKDWLKEKNIGS